MEEELIAAARDAMARAYAPYSRFAVGAAIRDADGAVHRGCNVENVAFPEGTCAEAGAIAAMVAAGGRAIAAIAVIADAPDPVPPCGGCRQKIAEFAGPGTRIVMATAAGAIREWTMDELLPGAFGPGHMGGG